MSNRNVTLGMTVDVDMTKARAEVDAFFKELKSRSARIPVSTDMAGGAASATSTPGQTIGGLSAGSVATASPNLSFFASQIVQGINSNMSALMARMPANSVPGSPSMPMGSASPNWSYYFGQQQQAMQAMMPTSSPNWSYLLANQGGGAGGPGGGGGRGYPGLYGRRGILSNAFGGVRGGALALTAMQVGSAYGEYGTQMDLAGGYASSQSESDIRQQLKAEQQFQGRIKGVGFGILGGIAGFLADPGGQSEIGTERMLRSADLTDSGTRSMGEGASFRRQFADRAAVSTAGSEYQQRQESLTRNYQAQIRKITDEKNKQLERVVGEKQNELQSIKDDSFLGIKSNPFLRDLVSEDPFAAQKTAISKRYEGLSSKIEGDFAAPVGDAGKSFAADVAALNRSRAAELFGLNSQTARYGMAASGRYRDASRQEIADRYDERLMRETPDPSGMPSSTTVAVSVQRNAALTAHDTERRRADQAEDFRASNHLRAAEFTSQGQSRNAERFALTGSYLG